MHGLFFAVRVTKSELAVEKLITSEESGSASNYPMLDLFFFSLTDMIEAAL